MDTRIQDRSEREAKGRAALLVVDVQQGLFRRSRPIYGEQALLDTICALIIRARRAGAPIIYTQHTHRSVLAPGSLGWQLHPRLQTEPGDIIVHKRHGSAFRDTALVETLEAREIHVLVVAGLVTHGCVRATCVDGSELGYHIVLVADGHSNYQNDGHTFIQSWNEKLGSRPHVELRPAQDVAFECNAQSRHTPSETGACGRDRT